MEHRFAPASTHPTGPSVVHPEWARSATIYQVNTRQFTPQGTFAAATEQLPRLAELGVGIVWLMPVHEIGELKRKGKLGSPGCGARLLLGEFRAGQRSRPARLHR